MKNFDKIVDLIIKELLSAANSEETEKSVIERLLRNGYRMQQIDEAFEFIIKKIRENEEEEETGPEAIKIRVLSHTEKYKLTAEAHRHLLGHYYGGHISLQDTEEILTRIEKINHIIDLEHLQELIQRVLFKKINQNSLYYQHQIN